MVYGGVPRWQAQAHGEGDSWWRRQLVALKEEGDVGGRVAVALARGTLELRLGSDCIAGCDDPRRGGDCGMALVARSRSRRWVWNGAAERRRSGVERRRNVVALTND